jgi:5-methyltetrahydrofolate--homocysteine methyltransferase
MDRREWMDLLARRVLLLDGGLATLLLAEKVPGPGSCPEVFLLEAAGSVESLHRRYARAGADILLSNTFGGNRVRLQAGGLAGKLGEINRRGIEVARRAGGSRCLVAADIGPTGWYRKGRKRPPSGKVTEIFREQAETLASASPDLFVLETFADPREIALAVAAVRKVSDLPVVALMTFGRSGRTALGFDAVRCRRICLEAGADVVGVNCSHGARSVLAGVKAMGAGATGPLAAEPNAGLPRWRNGRRRYDETPAALARYAWRYVRAGARLVGGCCGTTPAHIAAIRRALL